MSDYEVVEYHHYCSPGVRRVLASRTSAFIGEVDDSTILEYPVEPGAEDIYIDQITCIYEALHSSVKTILNHTYYMSRH